MFVELVVAVTEYGQNRVGRQQRSQQEQFGIAQDRGQQKVNGQRSYGDPSGSACQEAGESDLRWSLFVGPLSGAAHCQIRNLYAGARGTLHQGADGREHEPGMGAIQSGNRGKAGDLSDAFLVLLAQVKVAVWPIAGTSKPL